MRFFFLSFGQRRSKITRREQNWKNEREMKESCEGVHGADTSSGCGRSLTVACGPSGATVSARYLAVVNGPSGAVDLLIFFFPFPPSRLD